jgi:hypothetical protein
VEKVEKKREDFRRLPPRVTPEQMVPLQPVVHVLQDPREGDEAGWDVRMGWAG